MLLLFCVRYSSLHWSSALCCAVFIWRRKIFMFIFHVDSGRRTNGKMLKGKSGVARANDNEKRAPTQMDLGVVENPLSSATAEFFRKNKGGKFRSSLSFPRVDSNIHFFPFFSPLSLALFWGRRQRSLSSTKKAKFIHPRREIVVEFICVRLCDCVVWCEKLYHFHLYSNEQQQQNEMIWGPRRFLHLFSSVSTFSFILVHNSLDLVIWEKTELCSTGAQNLLNQAQRQKWREKWDRNKKILSINPN